MTKQDLQKEQLIQRPMICISKPINIYSSTLREEVGTLVSSNSKFLYFFLNKRSPA